MPIQDQTAQVSDTTGDAKKNISPAKKINIKNQIKAIAAADKKGFRETADCQS